LSEEIRKTIHASLFRHLDRNVSDADSGFACQQGYVVSDAMDVDEQPSQTNTSISTDKAAAPQRELTPEVEIFIGLLVLVHLVDNKKVADAVNWANTLLGRLESFNRRTLDPLSSRVFFYYSRAHEINGHFAEIRPKLLALQRTATLRHNYDGQITLLNLLLRNYLNYNLFDQADKLVSKTEFKEEFASSNEQARYYYYYGRIRAVQLNYGDAFTYLTQALRKAPQSAARGFRAAVQKLMCIVQLLMGDIPERSFFNQRGIRGALSPYLEVTQAVRSGDVAHFQRTVQQYASAFQKDQTYTLIQRMRNNVIKTGLRRINMSYSRISMQDICTRLALESVEDAEYIVAKAIRDNIIDATVNHAEGYIQSRETGDVYSTTEPQAQFHRRIKFCLDIHNDTVKAMRYPANQKKDVDAEEARKRAEEEAEEISSLDDFDDEDFF
jgi:26S proteasome regulatory subunit N3